MPDEPRPKPAITPQQISEALGTIVVPPENMRLSGLNARQVNAARQGVINTMTQCLNLSAEYNQAALDTGRDARLAFDATKVERDRATLRAMFTEDYHVVNPYAERSNRDAVVEIILSGKILKAGWGADGFMAREATLKIHGGGDTAILTGMFWQRATARVRDRGSATYRRIDMSGLFRTTHVYVQTGNRWQLAGSHLIGVPHPARFEEGPAAAPRFGDRI